MSLAPAFNRFLKPPQHFGPIPFWFWNDDLDEETLLAQLRAFAQAGCGGVLIHPRIGLSSRVGYLTEAYFRLVRTVVTEAARLELAVILYDEASYPSGSAQGRVVATNPAFASQAMGLWEREIEGPYKGYWRPNTGRALLDTHLCTVLGRQLADGTIDPHSLELLPPHKHTIFHLDLPAGSWKVMSVWNTASGGHVRGAFPHEESGHATAPAAGDILNPEAVDCFIRLTHDQYHKHLGEFFGTTIIALFTDEPAIFGKGAQRPKQAMPYTPGLLNWLQQCWNFDPRPWLPALWTDYGPQTKAFRRRFTTAIQDRLHQVFYRAQSQWCQRHGIALTGHPSGSNELSALRFFQLPGQDMVWRWVLPNDDTALEGAHSVAPKAATSGARMEDRQRILTEVCGAYGWQLSLDEVKWLFDWHLVRGNNLINPHAFFYSIRHRRAWESEPDMGLHNNWWPYFPRLARYTARLCHLLHGGEQICSVAILGDGNALPWQGAKQLLQNQIDFLYIDAQAVAVGRVEEGRLLVGQQAYRAVLLEDAPPLSEGAQNTLDAFVEAGGQILEFAPDANLPQQLDQYLPRDLCLDPAHSDLRFIHYRKEGIDYYLLVNEGEDPIATTVEVAAGGQVEIWDPLEGTTLPRRAWETDAGLAVDLHLERRASLILAIDPTQPFIAPEPAPTAPTQSHLPALAWTVTDIAGHILDVPAPGDWAQHPSLSLYSGTLHYRAQIDLPAAKQLRLDLGQVGEIAAVYLDGQEVGVRMWAPYIFDLSAREPGLHQLEIHVTNSMANEYEGLQLPSGLLGPVRLFSD